jgi:hypothetical protein
VIVLIYDGGFWKPYACGLSCTYTEATSFIETSVKGSGKWEESIPQKNSATGSITGITTLNKVNTLALSDLRNLQRNHTKLNVKFQRTDNDANVYTDEFFCYISNSSDEGPNDGLNTFTVDFKVTGPVTSVFVPTPINPFGKVKRYEYSGTGGEFSFSSSLLIGKDVLEVVKDGLGRAELITSGTPNNNQAKYTSATGTIEVAMAFEPDEKAYVLYQDL